MPYAICLHSRDEIAAFLQRDPALHLYELGDLDDFFWPYTTWYAFQEGGSIVALALLYAGSDPPVLLALGAPEEREVLAGLLRGLQGVLPRRFYAHLSPGLAEDLAADYRVEPHGRHLKMVLADRTRLDQVDTAAVVQLAPDDLPELEALYEAAYPGNWFDPRMLETGHYYGLRQGAGLVCAAGVHVYSPTYGVAALGNITTHPASRGQGLATRVTARLCRALLETVAVVGLNVKEDNGAAIACYRRLGFTEVGGYEELTLEVR